jgi:hypothetical protein
MNDETTWACACIQRDEAGNLSAIKVNHVTVKRCKDCGSERPIFGKYYCSGCRRLMVRDSERGWIESYCGKALRKVRMYRV